MLPDLTLARARMVDEHLAGRDITDLRVLDAFRRVPREEFVPPDLVPEAYEDRPLQIGMGQTISQPYIVALTAQALRLEGGERVLEVGAGSGYAAAILACLAGEVYAIERLESLARSAAERLFRLGFSSIHLTAGDGSVGWPEHAPYDAIAVAAGGPKAPEALLAQLAIGGRLVIPIGADQSLQSLVRITRVSETEYTEEALLDVRFVPLIGQQAWAENASAVSRPAATPTPGEDRWPEPPSRFSPPAPRPRGAIALPALVGEVAEPLGRLPAEGEAPDPAVEAAVAAIVERIGDARLVLLGESTHGTSEFYRMRARITRELIARRGFQFVAVEADWPDAARIDDYVRGGPRRSSVSFTPFERFPTWMWRNEEVHDFTDWLRAHNAAHPERKAGFHGLDLYSLFTSIDSVLAYLDRVDPSAARVARHRYGLLTPWQKDPAAYGEAVLVGRYESSEKEAIAMLRDLLSRRIEYSRQDGERFFDAAQNARLVVDAEHYYRAMYYGNTRSWNLRDTHMVETLASLFSFHGSEARGVVWEHNSHVGDARATEMKLLGEHNVGELCRERWGEQVYIIGFGTDHGTVAAAPGWGEPMEVMNIVPGRTGSYERLFHETALPSFTLPLRHPRRHAVREELLSPLLERAIGVIYRPQTEFQSHYFSASLPRQFDEYIWFDESHAVTPLAGASRTFPGELPDTYPFGV